MTTVRFDPVDSFRGELRPPADKSISHRGLLLGAFADGTSKLTRCLDAADTRSTLDAIESLGAEVTIREEGLDGLDLEISGFGLTGAAAGRIDVGNSGTLIRLLMGLLSGQPAGEWVLEGDSSIAERPMDRAADPLIEIGATIACRDGSYPPVTVTGSRIEGGRVDLHLASAQVKSAILLAGLNAAGPVRVSEPAPSRNHTELMLSGCGVEVVCDGLATTVSPPSQLSPLDLSVPGDISSAAFAIVAAILAPQSALLVEGVGLNPTRTGILDILELMGAGQAIERASATESGGEQAGDLEIRSSELRGVEIGGDLIPRTIDELPLLGLLGCFADGETILSDAAELRVKESDRIDGVVSGLSGLGAEIEETTDGFKVTGTGGIAGGVMDARGDHRLAMLGAVAGLVSRDGVEVTGFEASQISYPDFERDLRSLSA
jgi:3-phosphoshikimate 1-carboxyvinyltransferase